MSWWLSRSQMRETLLIAGPALVVILAAFWLAFQFVEPAPPKSVTITSGSEGGGYYAFAGRYAEILERSGVTLRVLPSAGSIENLRRLGEESADLALIQGGIASSLESEGQKLPEIVSLGRVFLEPLWVFHRLSTKPTTLAELKGRRLAIGPQGSGTRVLVEALLAPNGVDAGNSDLRPLGGRNAAEALKAGEVDVAFLALAPEAPLVRELLRAEGLELMNLRRAEAYTRLFPYLSRVTLPAGVVDLVADIPSEDVSLLAAQAAVVARADTHPAIVALMVEALRDVHGAGGIFQRVDMFPQHHDPEFEMSADAERMYKEGPTFLNRYLPFWLANFIERMMVMIVPIATILLPLVKIVPWVYETRIKSRIFYWFQELRAVEQRMESRTLSPEEWPELREEMEEIDRAVNNIPVPWHFADRYYELKAAVDLVRQRVETRAYESISVE